MKKPIIIAAISVVVGLALGALLFRGNAGHDHGAEGGPGNAGGEAKKEIWTCSMHPQIQAPKPGKCPICAMDLIPQSSMGASAGGAREFSMSEVAKALAQIETTEVIHSNPEAVVHLYGKIDHDETRMRSLTARFPGRIDNLYVDYEGVRVSEGDELGVIYSPDLLSAQTELLSAIRFGNTSAISIAKDKLRLWGFSEDRIRKIVESEKTSDRLPIQSPLTGIVTKKMVMEGTYVETGEMMFMIADHSVVWLMLEAYESDLRWLRYGQELTFTTETYQDREFTGRIVFIDHDIDAMTRTAKIRVNVENPGMFLKPGMFAHATVRAQVVGEGQVIDPSLVGKWISPMHPQIIKDGPGQCDICGMDLVKVETLGYFAPDEKSEPPLVIPAGAVLHTGKRSVVYVEKPDTEQPTYEGREILLGPRAGDSYIVEAGLKAGERVVSQGGFVIDSALQIQAKSSMMLPDEVSDPLFPEAPAPDNFLRETDGLLNSYFTLQKALADDSLKRAHESVDEFKALLEALPVDILPPPSVEIWQDLSDRLEESIVLLRSKEQIEPLRKEFQNLTILVDEVVRRFGTAHLPVFEHYCPMAFDNKGASWLQIDDNLLNPYFGASMLQCGEVRGQIAEAKSQSLGAPGDAALRSVVSSYLATQKALSEDQYEEASEQLAKSEQSLASLRDHDDEAVAILAAKIADRMIFAQKQEDTEALRLVFKEISGSMETLVVRFGAALETPLFKAHCPMAFNNAGADWLQTAEKIRNPYFGASMLDCGEIKKQLTGAVEMKDLEESSTQMMGKKEASPSDPVEMNEKKGSDPKKGSSPKQTKDSK